MPTEVAKARGDDAEGEMLKRRADGARAARRASLRERRAPRPRRADRSSRSGSSPAGAESSGRPRGAARRSAFQRSPLRGSVRPPARRRSTSSPVVATCRKCTRSRMRAAQAREQVALEVLARVQERSPDGIGQRAPLGKRHHGSRCRRSRSGRWRVLRGRGVPR